MFGCSRRARLAARGGLALSLLLVLAACAAPPARPSSGPAGGDRPDPASASAAGASQPAPSTPTRFTMVLVSSVTSHNPYSQSGGGTGTTWLNLFEGVVRFNPIEKIYEPLVAERWEVVAPTTWRLFIRQGIRFSDGSPLTAADVQHSLIERALNDPDSNRGSSLTTVQDATIVDDYTVDVHTKVPDAALLLSISTVPITSKAHYERLGKQAADRQPISAGAYTLQELTPDQRVVLRKNPHYWRLSATAPDEVVIRWIKEPLVGLTALLGGEVDMSAPLPPNLIPQLNGQAHVRPQPVPSGVIYFLALSAIGPLAQKPVRQAIHYAVDKDALVEGVLKGNAKRADTHLLETSIGYASDVTPRYTHDPARARQLLAEAGHPGGFQTDLYHPVGRYTGDVDIASVLVAQLAQVGIQVALKPTETPTFLARTRSGTFPMYLYGSGSVDEPNRYLLQFFRSGYTRLLGGWQSPEVDRLHDAETAEFDPAKRNALLRELQSRLLEESPSVPLLSFVDTVGISNRWAWDTRHGYSTVYFDTIQPR